MAGPAGIALRLAEARLVPYALPFRRPFATARETLSGRRGWAVWLRDDAGRWGVGEAAPLAGFGMESPEACLAALEQAARTLPGRTVRLPAAWSPDLEPGLGLLPPGVHAPGARHGLECAVLDLAAQAAGLPLARWLHPRAAPDVAVNATLGAAIPAEAARQAREAVAQGFATLKVKVGVGGTDADWGRLAAVRAAAGADVRLRVDANAAWDEATALAALRRLAPAGIEYAEQPLPPEDLAGLARLRRASPIPLAADEAACTEAGALAVLAAGAADVLVLKPMALGGLLATMRVATRALEAGVPAVLTTMLEGAFARLAALHAAAALAALAPPDAPPPACGLATGALLGADLVPHPPAPVRGRFPVPGAPGLGLPGTSGGPPPPAGP